MTNNRRQTSFNFGQWIRKFFLSSFVISSFFAYVIHERFSHPDSPMSVLSPAAPSQPLAINTSIGAPAVPTFAPTLVPPTSTILTASTQAPVIEPSSTPMIAASTSLYKDGTYTGPIVDAYYGLVRVQATVQHGSLVNVQFLQYPNDRRTSVQINSIAMPYLQQEAIQAQNANVDIISGATLTSEAFILSLRNALQSAKN